MTEDARSGMDIPGLIGDEEYRLLYKLSKENKIGPIVEIGSFTGLSTTALGYGSKNGKRFPVFSIDPHDIDYGMDGCEISTHFFRNMISHGLLDVVRPIETLSAVPVKNWNYGIGLLWIDGDHSYEGCRQDVNNWLPHVAVNGKIVFHDYEEEQFGVTEVVDQVLKKKAYQYIDQKEKCVVIQKKMEDLEAKI